MTSERPISYIFFNSFSVLRVDGNPVLEMMKEVNDLLKKMNLRVVKNMSFFLF